MRVLALEPYRGGSHKALVEGWSAHSSHQWEILSLPPNRWRWRTHHAAITFADEVARRVKAGASWDIVLCSDMLNLAEFFGLVPPEVQRLPSIAYFHENYLTCPVHNESERDYHLVFTNLTSALAATHVWFNSAFHRDSFLAALPEFLEKMPDYHPLRTIDRIRDKSSVHPPGIVELPPRGARPPGPMRILWAARWEHEKNPETFFQALKVLKWSGAEFRLSVLGQQLQQHPPAFDWARQYFYYHIDWWGFQANRHDYEDALAESDVIVSTAEYEFFSVGVIEAIAAGCYPLVPKRLAYPEILDLAGTPANAEFFYEGGADELGQRLIALAERTRRNNLWQDSDPQRARQTVARYAWEQVAPHMDKALERIAADHPLR